ncbi:MAG: FecR domain-containing protein [Alphaproteobacteria bacterium]
MLEAAPGTAITVPHGTLLLVADFARQGADLLLTGPDGQQVLIEGYFASENPPSLTTSGGAVLAPEMVARLAGPLAPGQYAQASGETGATAVGSVETIEGTVTAIRADGSQVILEVGSPIFQDDVIETGSGGAIGLAFIDDTTFSLGEDSRMVIDELIYDPATGDGSMSLAVIQGAFVFLTGEIAGSGDDAMMVTTPVATIGIRGTKVVGYAAQEGELNTVTLLQDDDGSVGTIIISTPIGQIILDATNYENNAVFISSSGAAPVIGSFSPSQFENLFGPPCVSTRKPSAATSAVRTRKTTRKRTMTPRPMSRPANPLRKTLLPPTKRRRNWARSSRRAAAMPSASLSKFSPASPSKASISTTVACSVSIPWKPRRFLMAAGSTSIQASRRPRAVMRPSRRASPMAALLRFRLAATKPCPRRFSKTP